MMEIQKAGNILGHLGDNLSKSYEKDNWQHCCLMLADWACLTVWRKAKGHSSWGHRPADRQLERGGRLSRSDEASLCGAAYNVRKMWRSRRVIDWVQWMWVEVQMTRTSCKVWGVASSVPVEDKPNHWEAGGANPPFHPLPSPAAAVTKPCDDLPQDLPRYRTDFVTYCSATRYFHLPLHMASLQQALDAATSQAESATLPRFNRDTRDTGCKRERTKDTSAMVGGGGGTW